MAVGEVCRSYSSNGDLKDYLNIAALIQETTQRDRLYLLPTESLCQNRP